MLDWWKNLGLQARFMLITSTGLLAVALCVIGLVGWFETSKVEAKLRDISESELKSLNALVSSAMEQRPSDPKDVALTVFNRWFEHRNVDYPGKLWSVWSPQMASFMAQMNAAANKSSPQHANKPPRDAIDEEVLRTGRPIGRFVDGAYRYSLPIVLGVTTGADQKLCYDCHGSMMNLGKGQVMAVFSSTLSTTAEFAALRRLLAGMAGVSLVGTLVLVLTIRAIFQRVISRRLTAMTAAMRRLAGGELATEIPATDRADEIGHMAQAMLVFRRNGEAARDLQADAEKARAVKDRRQAAMDRHTNDFGTSAAGVMASLTRSAVAMRTTAQEMSVSAQRTRVDALRTAEGATTSAQNLSAVAAAAEQMSASINEIGSQVGRASRAVHEAVGRSADTDAKVSAMVSAADRVGDVVRLISAIAGQTNLLALNATIEAARAGEAGKGFAVVAGEVKALASQTAKATEEIGTQIGAIRTATGEAVEAVRQVSASIGQVEEVATAIAAAVEQQATVTREIAGSVQTVTAATRDATRAMQEVSVVSEKTDVASRSVLEVADEVGRNADLLRDDVNHFLAAMARTDDERRLYERIPCQGTEAVLRPAQGAEFRAKVHDVSRGGVSLCCDWHAEAGTEVQVVMPGSDRALGARMVRLSDGLTCLAFRQDAATLALVDAILRLIDPRQLATAA